MDLTPIFVAVLGASGAAGVAIGAWMQRRKTTAEAQEIIGRAYGGVIDRLEKDIARLSTESLEQRGRIDELESELAEAKAERDVARREVVMLRIENQELNSRVTRLGVKLELYQQEEHAS